MLNDDSSNDIIYSSFAKVLLNGKEMRATKKKPSSLKSISSSATRAKLPARKLPVRNSARSSAKSPIATVKPIVPKSTKTTLKKISSPLLKVLPESNRNKPVTVTPPSKPSITKPAVSIKPPAVTHPITEQMALTRSSSLASKVLLKPIAKPVALPPEDSVIQKYRERSYRSRLAFEQAGKYIPGGVNTIGHIEPFPPYILRGEECYLRDIEGRRLLDFVNAGFSLPLGHNHPRIRQAVTRQAQNGMYFSEPTELEYQLAKKINERIPSIEKMRFTSSGTEAVMFALRVARAFTGRQKIAKMEGGYHGTSDSVLPGTLLTKAGKPMQSKGLLKGALEDTIVLPFNDLKTCETKIRANKDNLAAVIVEPVIASGGCIPPVEGFLSGLREITKRYGILLIFDETVTFTLSKGGAQALYNVTPDLTVLGKAIGGGMPIGVFGGRADVMATVSSANNGPSVPHSGSYSGHPISMAAGIAHLEALTSDKYVLLNALGDQLRTGLKRLADNLKVKLKVTGVGHLFAYHLTEANVIDGRSAATSDFETIHRLNIALLNRGFHVTMHGQGCVSTAMTFAHIDQFLKAMEESMAEVGLSKKAVRA